MKKLFYVALLAISALGLASCNGGEKTPKVSLESLGYQYTDVNAPIVREKNTINFKIISSKNNIALPYNEMKVFQDLYNQTNVNVNWENMTESAYAEKKTLIMSDKKQWPDAFYHAGFSDKEIIQYSSRKSILPIDQYLEYMPNFKGILEKRPDIKKIITSPDGHIYSLPRVEEMGLVTYPNLLFLNKTWVSQLIDSGQINFLTKDDLKDGLNLKLTDYEKILRLFKQNDMNKNNKNDDEIPLSFVFNNWQGNQADLFSTFGIPYNIDHKTIVDGKVVFTANQQGYKEAINFFGKWVKEGLIPNDVFTQGQDSFLATGKGKDQRLGSFYWWESETVVPAGKDEYITLNPLIGLDGKQHIGVSNHQEISKGNFVVLSKCQHPEVLLTYIDRFYDPVTSAQINYGAIGVAFEEQRDEKGMLVPKPIPEELTADELRLKNAPLGLIYLSKHEWENVVNMEPRAKLRLERLQKHAIPFTYENTKSFPNVSYTMAEINKISQIEGNVYTLILQNTTQWLLNGGVNDASWNEYIQKLEKIGIQELLKIYQDAYDRYNAA